MTKLIIDGKESNDTWVHLTDDELLSHYDFTVTVNRWHTEQDDIVSHLAQTGARLGVRLALDSDPLLLGPDIDRFDLVVIEIPDAADGRFFSIAARVREHLRYSGELRVTGMVAIDQLTFMQRCGINSFAIGDPIDIASFTSRYQRHYQSSTRSAPSERLIRKARRRDANLSRRVGPKAVKRRYILVNGVIQQDSVEKPVVFSES